MTTTSPLWEVLGALIVVVSLFDIFVTAFHPTVQSPLTARFNRILWFIVKHVSAALPLRSKRWLLSWTLPLSVLGLLMLWLLALLLGFALIYAPHMEQRGAFGSMTGKTQWGDAFYLSGQCLTSIGFGDIVPRTAMLRAVSVGEGVCGLLVVGITITYVLTVFPVLPVLRIMATTLNEETAGRADALGMVRRYLAVSSGEALCQRCRELATELMRLADAHTAHPVLFYSHPKRVEQSFPRVLLVLQALVAVLRYSLRESDYPTLVRDPRIVGLEETFVAVLRQLGQTLHLQVQSTADAATARALAGRYETLLEELQQSGLRSDARVQRGERRAYVHFRMVTDPYIAAYCANTGYSAEELRGDHPPLRGATAPLYEEEEDEEEPA